MINPQGPSLIPIIIGLSLTSIGPSLVHQAYGPSLLMLMSPTLCNV